MSFNELKQCTLENISISIKTGKTPPSNVRKYLDKNEEGINFIGSKSVFDGYIDRESIINLNKESEEYIKSNYVEEDDILLNVTGDGITFGRNAIVTKDMLPAYTSQNIATIRINKDKANPKFVMYYLNMPSMKSYMDGFNSGSARRAISAKNIKIFELKLPAIEEQKAIAKILSDLDNKIEVNNKINKRLEDMAQSIFKSWFVDFEFPNEEGKSYKSSGGEMVESELGMIPKGWEVTQLGEISTVTSGKRPKKKSKEKTDECFIPLIGASSIMGYANEVLYDEKILIIGRVGTHGVVQRVHYKSWPSDNTLVIKSKCYEYTYQILNLIDYKGLNVGSTQPLITQTDIKNIEVLLPDSENLNRFEIVVGSLFNSIKKNNTENEKLSNLRDTILPKLMSGEIRVPIK